MTRWWLAIVPAVAICASCTSAVSGEPSTDSAAPKLPPRSREFRIDGLDPCSALTAAQLTSLHVLYYAKDDPEGSRGPGCEWIHSPTEPIETYTVDINTKGGVELAFGQPQLAVLTVAGFGAVSTPGLFSSGQHDCIVNIDVAPSQAVQVGYFYNGASVPMTHEIACQKARHAAELAMQTILAKVGG
jgi:hypothetical protein